MTPRLIDIHTHVNFNAFKEDSDVVIRHTLDEGVWMILVGSQLSTSQRALAFALQYEKGVYVAAGLHPIHLTEGYWDTNEIGAPLGAVSGFKSKHEVFDYDHYKTIAKEQKVVAIGECGLDYYRVEEKDEIKQSQHETFRAQIQLARELKKPLMVHCRQGHGKGGGAAYDDCIQILKEERGDEVGGDIHFFAGDRETAEKFLDFGFHLSFTGVITFVRDYDDVIKQMPLDRIMIETDAPYVSPTPYRGKRNEPLYVEEVARRIAEIRGMEFAKIAEQTTHNAIKLFNLK